MTTQIGNALASPSLPVPLKIMWTGFAGEHQLAVTIENDTTGGGVRAVANATGQIIAAGAIGTVITETIAYGLGVGSLTGPVGVVILLGAAVWIGVNHNGITPIIRGYGKFIEDLVTLDPNLAAVAKDIAKAISDIVNPLIADAAAAFGRAFTSPIVFDLDNNGFGLLHAQDGVHFDIDADGFAEKTGWIKPTEAFLVRDVNGNGVIDSQAEMFGTDATSTAAEKLAAMHKNGDGFVTSKDAGWGTLRLWKDANGDGVSQADELFTLASQGVAKLGVDAMAA